MSVHTMPIDAGFLKRELKKEILKQEISSGKKASQSGQLTLASRLKLIRMESAGVQPDLKIR